MTPKTEDIEKWKKHIYAYFHALEADKESKDDVDIFRGYLDSFVGMLETMTENLKARDEWEFFYSGSLSIARSKKMELDFRFGAYLLKEFYMESFISYPKHLKKMPNEFWRIMLELGDFGHFEFQENCTSPNGKSDVFNIVQSYLELESEVNETEDDPFMDFGFIVVSWPLRTSIKELFANAFEVFTRMYKLNYMLYRAEYILQKSRKKRI